jgi:hypothetical protein
MFMDIWDKDNTSIRINKFDKRLIARNNTAYDALYKFDYDYGIKTKKNDGYNIEMDFYQIQFSSIDSEFNQTLNFAVLIDCLMFMLSDTFTYLFESEDIDYIIITAGKKVMFEYDNRE